MIITYRELQRLTVKELLEELPVTVTAYGKEVLIVDAIDAIVKPSNQRVSIKGRSKTPKIKSITFEKGNRPFDICPKHRVFFSSCGD